MNKDSKILLIALIIIFIGAFSLNYTNMTGKSYKDIASDHTTISVSPRERTAGETITIDIDPGLNGIYSEIEIYRVDENDIRLGRYTYDICESDKHPCVSNRCYERITVDYPISKSWDNNNEWHSTVSSKTYYARVYDIYSGTYKIAYFTVERTYQKEGPAKRL